MVGYMKYLFVFLISLLVLSSQGSFAYPKCSVTGGACAIKDLFYDNQSPEVNNEILKQRKLNEKSIRDNSRNNNEQVAPKRKFNTDKLQNKKTLK